MPDTKPPNPEVKDKNARQTSQSAMSTAREALRLSKANAEAIKMFQTKLDEHTTNSANASKQVMTEVLHSREAFTAQFNKLDETVSKLNLRASVEDQQMAIDTKVATELERNLLQKRLKRSRIFATIAWIAAVIGGFAALGGWLDPHPFHFTITTEETK